MIQSKDKEQERKKDLFKNNPEIQILINKLPETIKLHSLKLQETGTSHAEWYASDQKTI